jgi:hypothetical protein
MKVKELIKELQKYKNQDYQLVYDMFCEDDIKEQAADMEVTLTDEQVTEVIEWLERKADATQGMCWETIDYTIQQVTEG